MWQKIKNGVLYLWQRWWGKMPTFFRWVFWVCASLSTMQGGIAEALANGVIIEHAPAWFIHALRVGSYVTAGAGIIAKLTLKDAKQMEP
jgi:hypothetical protein